MIRAKSQTQTGIGHANTSYNWQQSLDRSIRNPLDKRKETIPANKQKDNILMFESNRTSITREAVALEQRRQTYVKTMAKLSEKFGKENQHKFRGTVDRFMLMRPNVDDP